MLGLRSTALSQIKIIVISGKTINSWFDPWYRDGAQSASKDYVLGSWHLPDSNSSYIMHWKPSFKYSHASNLNLVGKVTWKKFGGHSLKASHFWEVIRPRAVPLHKRAFIWFKLQLCGYSFLYSLILRDRMNYL